MEYLEVLVVMSVAKGGKQFDTSKQMVLLHLWAESDFVDLVLCEVLVYVSANQEEMINDFVSETRAVVEVMYESAWKDSCVRSTSGHVKKQRTKV